MWIITYINYTIYQSSTMNNPKIHISAENIVKWIFRSSNCSCPFQSLCLGFYTRKNCAGYRSCETIFFRDDTFQIIFLCENGSSVLKHTGCKERVLSFVIIDMQRIYWYRAPCTCKRYKWFIFLLHELYTKLFWTIWTTGFWRRAIAQA